MLRAKIASRMGMLEADEKYREQKVTHQFGEALPSVKNDPYFASKLSASGVVGGTDYNSRIHNYQTDYSNVTSLGQLTNGASTIAN